LPLKFLCERDGVTGVSPLRGTLRRAGLVLGVGGLGALCALVVSACGSSSASNGTTTSTTTTAAAGTTTTGSASFTAYQSCLKAHGVSFPTGGFGGGGFRRGATGASGATGAAGAPPTGATGATGRGGFPRRNLTPTQQNALNACASLRPTGGFGGGAGGPGGGSNSAAFAKFQTCLKNHGVDTSRGGGFDRTSTAGQAAFAACRSLLPQGGFGGRFGGPGGGAGATGSGGASSGSFQALQNCLKAHGVQTGSASKQSAAKTAAAIATCRSQVLGGGSSTTTTTSG
jgi:hypothetical protein